MTEKGFYAIGSRLLNSNYDLGVVLSALHR